MLKTGLAVVIALIAAVGAAGAGWPTDRIGPVRFERPPAWAVQRFGNYCGRVGPGELVSSAVGHTFEHPAIKDGCTNGWKLGGLPSGFVLVDVSAFAWPPGPPANTPLPLSLDSTTPSHPSGCRCTSRVLAILTPGCGFEIRVWMGNEAGAAARRAADAIVASIRCS